MTRIFEARLERSLEHIVAEAKPGERIEAWTFDDRPSRRAAEAALAEKGVTARLRSAYKPLLHAFLEEIDLEGVTGITIRYPVHPEAPENRFRLEAYPLAALVGGRPLAFKGDKQAGFDYRVDLQRGDMVETLTVFAPNRSHLDATGKRNLSPTGWIRRNDEAEGEALRTDYEALFEATMRAVVDHPWSEPSPYFEELAIVVSHPAEDERLPVGDEALSLREALHEEFYFSLLEYFTTRAGLPVGHRGARPGQIVPEIVKSGSELSVRVETRAFSSHAANGAPQMPVPELDRATAPLAAEQVSQALGSFKGETFGATSRAGRAVEARYIAGDDAAVMISAGQHANETTGVVGALRAAAVLCAKPKAHFTISPLENPDGYALHRRLCRDNPRHMHHAARYTALGDDLEYRTRESGTPLYEKDIRFQAQAMSGAGLHINLHGYPSHEWTRPLSGYVPHNFAMWTVPKGFFLVSRYRAGYQRHSEILLDRVTRRLGALPGLIAYNARQIELYEIHAGATQFEMVNGFPCLSSESEQHDVPVTLITEYPDETIYGEDFIAGHSAQMETVLGAYEAWQEIALSV